LSASEITANKLNIKCAQLRLNKLAGEDATLEGCQSFGVALVVLLLREFGGLRD